MNSREFLTQALLSCHQVLMEAALPDDLPDDDELLDSEIRPIAEKIGRSSEPGFPHPQREPLQQGLQLPRMNRISIGLADYDSPAVGA
jgi:hypothetical protein